LFHDYSALEFKSIIKLKPCKSQGNTLQLGANHPSWAMFPLDPGHPLYGKYKAVICIKFQTAMLVGCLPLTAGYCIIIPTSPLWRNVFAIAIYCNKSYCNPIAGGPFIAIIIAAQLHIAICIVIRLHLEHREQMMIISYWLPQYYIQYTYELVANTSK
jgi:hypothetical protein